MAPAPPAPRLADRIVGAAFFALWRAVGWLALPALLLNPRARRHIWRLPHPEPGWTWLHGDSAGEQVAARALAAALISREPTHGRSSLCWRTASSWRTPVMGAFPAPLDLPLVVEAWLDRARPARLVLVEAALWPGWIVACRRRGIPVAVVNARPSRGTARWRRIGPLWRWLTHGVSFIPAAETGDLKRSAPPDTGAPAFDSARPAFLATSTRPGDEALLLQAWARLPAPPLLLLAPRHLSRLPEIIALIEQTGLRWVRRSALDQGDLPKLDLILLDLILLDTMGEVRGLMPVARAAFVGGTFDPTIGGHSPAEALAAGLPVVHGPHIHANPEAWGQGVAFPAQADPILLAGAIQAALAAGPGPATRGEGAARCAARLPRGRPSAPEGLHRPWLAPLVPLWRSVAGRRRSYRGAPVRVGVPVVSVGGLAAGGTGKTPVVLWLAQRLDGVWIVARGYRRGGPPGVRVGLPGETPELPLGDELELLRRRGLPVISSPDRVEGAREAARRGARIILLDDGFGHRRLHRDLDIVCIDARAPLGGGPQPVGTLREPWRALSRADVLWVHHADAGAVPPAPPPLRVLSRVRPQDWLIAGLPLPLSAVRGSVSVTCGIAAPSGFLCTLIGLGLEVGDLRLLPDHGPIEARDFPENTVLTEKDAARLPPGAAARALRIDLEVEGAEPLLARIRGLISQGAAP